MKILMWTDLRSEIEGMDTFLERADLILIDAPTAKAAIARALEQHPHLVMLDESMPGGAIEVIRTLRATAATGPAPRFLVRTERSARPLADGVISIPRAEGMPGMLAAMTRLLQVPVRAAARVYSLIEARGRAQGDKLYDATIVDVSIGGLKLRTGRALRVGESVTLSFLLAMGDPLIIAAGKIVRDAGSEGGEYLYGMEFTDLRSDDRAAISHFVERALMAARRAQLPATEPVTAPA